MSRPIERSISCLKGDCREELGGIVGEAVAVVCPFAGTPAGDGVVVLAGGEGDWVRGP
jgi:hypothetical protein